jgi:hypothetical protein
MEQAHSALVDAAVWAKPSVGAPEKVVSEVDLLAGRGEVGQQRVRDRFASSAKCII